MLKRRNMRIGICRSDIIWSYLGMSFTMAVNLILLPLYVYYFSEDTLGLWYVFLGLGGIALLFDFGFSVTFARNITYCWSGVKRLRKQHVEMIVGADVNYPLLKTVLRVCKLIYAVLAGTALVLIFTGGMYYVYYISPAMTEGELRTAWGTYGLGIVLNLYYGYYLAFLRGVGAIKLANKSIVYARLLQLMITIVLLVQGYGIIGASIGYLVYGFGFKIFGKRYFYEYKDIGSELNKVDYDSSVSMQDMFYTLWHNAWRDGIVSIANYMSVQATTLLCSLYLTLAETGVFSMALQFTTAVAVIGSTLYNTYQSAVQNAYVLGDMKRVKNIFSCAVTVFIILYLLGIILLIGVGMPLLHIIKPQLPMTTVIILGTALMQFVIYYRNCYIAYFACTNRIIYVNAFVIAAVVGLVLAVCFVSMLQMGLWGILSGTIFSQLIFNSWYWIYKVNKEMNLTLWTMLRQGVTQLMLKKKEG